MRRTTGLLAMVLLLWCGSLLAENHQLYVGEVKILQFPGPVERFATGNEKILGGKILDEGTALLVSAVKEGETDLVVWLKTGQKITHKFFITGADSGRTSAEVAETLKSFLDITTRTVGKNIIIEGRVDEQTGKMIEKVVAKYPDIINLTTQTTDEEIFQILQMLPNLKVSKVGQLIVVRGNVDADSKAALEIIKGQFSQILDLTSEKLLVDEPMIFMNVKITEFGNSALRNLGIDWTTSFAGPSGAYAKDFRSIGNDPTTSVWNNQTGSPITGNPQFYARAADGTPTLFSSVRDSVGYFGIATMITSAINLAVTNGDAMILASPTLSAKSGGKAEFLAGGQIPITVPQGDGTNTTEFKDYGITLNIEPKAGKDGSITSKVVAEVSNIDKSVTNSLGVPGFLSRKASTEVNMNDGQTLVISGLVNREITNSVKKVAGLGDLPVLGYLFKSTDFNNKKSDLVIFITPHIAGANSAINQKGLRQAAQLRERFLKSIDKGVEILD